MNTGRTHFKKGNRAAKAKKGKLHKSTLIKINLQEKIGELDNLLYKISIELLNSRNIENRKFAWKELLKYRLIQVRDLTTRVFDETDIEEKYKVWLHSLPKDEYRKKIWEAKDEYTESLSDEELKNEMERLKKSLNFE